MVVNFKKLEVKDFKKDRYKKVYPEKEGMRLVQTFDDLYGFFNNETGELQIPCIYHYAESFSEGKALVEPKISRPEYINYEGVVVVGRLGTYDKASSYHENRAKVKTYVSFFIDQYGNKIGEDDGWANTSDFNEGLALVLPSKWDDIKNQSVIDLDGNIVFTLPKDHRFEDFDLVFYDGYAPIIITSYRKKEKYELEYRYANPYEKIETKGFVDKTGTIISDHEEVKKINELYTSAREKAAKTIDTPIDPNKFKLNWYCSTITYPGGSISLQADTEEELIEQKKEVFTSLMESLNNLKQQIADASTNNVLQRKKEN